ncbi:hypothetical protein LTR05_005006 [Lithohypha guttulata]|uniref:Non-reducing end beta-L-arabinofuranosidase-like GH127 catalytic domain-containing protein n=1 Tax=Lithohypha guttulata TaxID=1690604 RepID=A0AAN7SZ94_9EURO|nr:hypothetical protein LTR05_005006 [Lithohypha guttulata]
MPQQWNTKTYGEQNGSIPYHRLNKTLYPLKFQPLPLGTIKAQGWFQQQLDLMAEGMPGRMHEFYRLVKDATWGGGKEEYSILNEAWPYYINGLVPLAFAVNNPQVLDAINRQISYVLLKQFPDGWLGPEADVSTRNFWGRYPFFLAAAQYVEAAGAAESQQMLGAMHRFVDVMHFMLKNDHQGYVWREGDHFDEQWGRSRAADMVLALQWLYENYPDNNQERIHECMFLIYTKAYDWSWWFRDDIFLKNNIESYPDELIDPLFPFLHVVNTAQGLKSPAVMGRLLHDQALFDSSRRGVQLTFDHHGVSSGAIIGDERMSGNSATRGSELCSVVEAMFSLSTLYQILGDASFADRLEKAVFNAMPAMIMPDWWAHQYVAQINQPYSYEIPDTHFWNVGPWGVTFGVEPNYPCCAVNFPQGYPKLLSSSWVRTPENNGIAHVVLIPSEIKTVLKQAHVSNHVHIRCNTNYPFTQLLEYHVEAQESFSFSFRVPEWVDLNNPKTGIYLDKSTDLHHTHHPTAQKPLSSRPPPGPPAPLKPDPHTGLHTISLPAGPLHFTVYLSPSSNTKPTIHQRPNNAVALTHGALLFALNIPSDSIPRRPANYQREGEAPPQANDWTIVPLIENNTSSLLVPWNIAIDPSTARVHEHENLSSNLSSSTNSTSPFTSSPITITVTACEISWPLTAPIQYEDHNSEKRAVRGGYPVEPPRPDPKTGKHECIGEAFEVELRPFGGAKIRMAEFPVVDLGGR